MSSGGLSPRTKRILAVAWGAVVVVVLLDLGLRLGTVALEKVRLARHPSIAQRLEGTRQVMPRATAEVALRDPADLPAPVYESTDGNSAPSWTTFRELPESAFRTPPQQDAVAPGVVRIAFFGGSTTFDGYPEETQKLFDAHFGPGRVEVINLGIPASNTASTVVLMNRFLPRWRSHIAVLYDGFNDLAYARSRVETIAATITGNASTAGDFVYRDIWSSSFGLVGAGRRLLGTDDQPLDPWWLEGVQGIPTSNHWQFARTGWREGAEVYLSTFARPDYATMAPDDRDFLAADIHFLWPVMGSTERYAADLDAYNSRVRETAKQSGAGLIDVAGGLHGGLDHFVDNCHLTAEGKKVQAQIVFDALSPRVTELLAAGAPLPGTRLPRPASPLVAAPPSPPHPPDGTCVQGPCPQGACYVPAGAATYGYSAAAIAPLAERIKRKFPGFTGIGFDDDVPEQTVELSAFCIDRTEATAASRAACVAAGACPPHVASPLDGIPADRSPAIMPTEIDAAAYCGWRGGRLPTDAEWEAAARGDTHRALPWGDAWTGKEANCCGSECPWGVPGDASDGIVNATAVDAFDSPSPYGLLGAAGNVWEWVADCFVNDARRLAAGRQDPIAPDTPHCRRFLRGGSYASLAGILERRTGEGFPDVGPDTRGVRCAYDFGIVHQPFGGPH